ncbi:MAG TPA: MotA/TolQ/ExbB proton channel family protein [Candidatus Wallbacteria bacterium]|nr:MotA/TolQ/ExbB proton channel family protein [Candidatus Wallbacteria bacterium]
MFQLNEIIKYISPVIIFLAALSVVTLSFYLERLFTIAAFSRRTRAGVSDVGELVKNHAGRERDEIAKKTFERLISKPEFAVGGAESSLRHYRVELDEAVENLRISIVKIGSVAALSPYIGLFGTVIGIMNSFSEIYRTGTSNFAYVSKGISEALVATAVGLFLAITASFCYNHLSARLRAVNNEKNSALERIGIMIESRRLND